MDNLGNPESGEGISEEEFDELFNTFDEDGSGTVEKAEMLSFIKSILGSLGGKNPDSMNASKIVQRMQAKLKEQMNDRMNKLRDRYKSLKLKPVKDMRSNLLKKLSSSNSSKITSK